MNRYGSSRLIWLSVNLSRFKKLSKENVTGRTGEQIDIGGPSMIPRRRDWRDVAVVTDTRLTKITVELTKRAVAVTRTRRSLPLHFHTSHTIDYFDILSED